MTQYKVEFEGADRLIAKLDRIGKTMQGQAAKEAVHAGGLQVQNHARLNIHQTFSRHQTGGLANSISTTSRQNGDGAEAEVAAHKVYARIQEFGGTIRPLPTNKRGLLFWRDPDTGRLCVARQVTLPARPYMRPAMENNQSDILSAMEQELDKYLARERE